MTWITDNTGTRWVDIPQKKGRASPRALRFAELNVGDQLVLMPKEGWYRKIPLFYVVTDMWFNPVAGQEIAVAGSMVALRHIGEDGEPAGKKSAHTLRGLASESYAYAGKDVIAERKARVAALVDGKVVGIGRGEVIRRRPKLPGGL